MSIHQLSVIDDSVKLGNNVKIGPFTQIVGDVEIGDNVEIKGNVYICGHGKTIIGDNCVVYPFTTLGTPPQDKKYAGEKSFLTIGKNNIIREHVTMNPGTESGGLHTRVGDNNLIMTGSHIGHDCQIGNDNILVNSATLAGHVIVEDNVIIGGLSAVHQFCRIGTGSMIGGMTGVTSDVIPFAMIMGNRGSMVGLNIVGLRRRRIYAPDDIKELRQAYSYLFEDSAGTTLSERLDVAAAEYDDVKPVMKIIDFIRDSSKRNICMPAHYS